MFYDFLESTDRRFELLIVDNNYPKSIPDYEELLDSRVRVVTSKSQLSMSKNWQFGLNKAIGSWVMYLGSDDGIVGKNLTEAIDLIESKKHVCDLFQFRSLGFTYSIKGRNPWMETPMSYPSRKSSLINPPKLLYALFPT